MNQLTLNAMNHLDKLREEKEPSPTDEAIQIAGSIAIDLEYARKQLSNAQSAKNVRTMQDCIGRAQDALDRVADAQASMIITLGNAQLEPSAEAQEWTIDEILAREG